MPVSIDKPSSYFNTTTYTGNGSYPRAITTGSFAPDFVWFKNRSSATHHQTYDSVRGTGTGGGVLYTSLTSAQDDTYKLTSFDSTGVTLSSSLTAINSNGDLNVVWAWKGNGAGVSNTAGTISSTVSANTTSGFSIVSYTGNATISTVGHGLGVAPKMLITKNRDQGTGGWNWKVYHASLGNTKDLTLNATTQALSPSDYGQSVSPFWNDTTPTSTVFTIGADGVINASGNKFIAYCFAEVKGFSKAFSYTGNGSADGTYVNLGFRPAWLLIKRTDSAGYDWLVYDNKRQVEYNVVDDFLKPNLSDAETTGNAGQSLDFLSNGIKFRGTGASSNASGGTYIGFAIAEQPFVSSKGIVANAR